MPCPKGKPKPPGLARHGNGAGRGGPAKGFVNRPSREFTGMEPEAVAACAEVVAENHDPATQAFRAEIKRLKREANREAWQALRRRLSVSEPPTDVIREALDRTEGPVAPPQRSTDEAPAAPLVQIYIPDNGRRNISADSQDSAAEGAAGTVS